MDLNKVMIIGRNTTDPDVRKIETTGTTVVKFSVATNRKFKNKDGNVIEEAEFHRCVAFGNSADLLSQYLVKGKKVYIEGRLRTRKWEDTNGINRYSTEIVIENFIFLDSRPTNTEHKTDTGEEALPTNDTEKE